MRVLVIGGTGFIGPHIVRELIRLGHDVTVFHRGRTHAAAAPSTGRDGSARTSMPRDARGDPRAVAREIIGDRQRLPESADELRAMHPDVVIDVVLSSGKQARELMTVFRGATARVVALSSMDVYRACGVLHGSEEGPLEPLPLTETSPVRTKLETYPPAQIQALQQLFGWIDEDYDKIPVEREILGDARFPGTVLRLPMVYGPGDPLHRFLPTVKRIADGRRSIVFSEGMAQWRGTKGYVENVGAAIALATVTDRAAGRIYNVGDPDTLTELEWSRLAARAMQWDGDFVVMPDAAAPPHLRPPGNSAQHWVADTTRIREELGFTEPVSREEAVRRTVEWELANPPSGFTMHRFDYEAEDAVTPRMNAT